MNIEISFESLNLSKETLKAIHDIGFENPTSVQSAVIPKLLEKKNIIVQSQTGTGKTAAFGIPIAEIVQHGNRGVQALVITPTRELAMQVTVEMAKLCKYKKLKELSLYGGMDIERQLRTLKQQVHIVVGTPGRILDHIRRGTLDLSHVKMVVLDEADEMLDLGFIENVEDILSETPSDRQTMLFSATVPERIKRLASRFIKDAELVSITPQEMTVKLIEQYYFEIKETLKFDSFCRIIDAETMGPSIVFCRTKKNVDELTDGLRALGYSVEGIHGDMSQAIRMKTLNKFKNGRTDFLIATDVAARGLDIEGITHVINYDIPDDPESYVHRIGRTGRAGKEGIAYTLMNAREFEKLKYIEKFTKSKIKRKDVPTLKDIKEQKSEQFKTVLIESLKNDNFSPFKTQVLELADEFDLLSIACAAFKYIDDIESKKFANATDDLNIDRRAPKGGDRPASEEGMVRLFLNLGKKDRIRPGDIVGAIAGESGLPGKIVGMIDIFKDFTYVDVAAEHVEKVLKAMKRNTIKGKKVSIETAKGKKNKG